MKRRHLTWPPKGDDTDPLRGSWVALDNCRYDGGHKPVEGDVVDSDEDLAELCARLYETGRSKCIILYLEPNESSDSKAGLDERLFT
jgi:hypothetical protein